MFMRPTDPDVSVDNGHLIVDGEVLEDVLAEVYRRCGPDARILQAERTIVGGIAGFFGREAFHVVARPATDEDHTGTSEESGTSGDEVDSGPVDGPSFAAALAEALNSTLDVEDVEDVEPPAVAAVAAADEPVRHLGRTRSAAVASRASAVASAAAAATAGYGITPPVPTPPPVLPDRLAPVVPLRWSEPAATVADTPPLPPLPTVEPAAVMAAEPVPETSDIPWEELPSDGPHFPEEHLLAGPTIVLQPAGASGEGDTAAAARWYDRVTDERTRALTELPLPELLAKIDRLLPLNVSRPPAGIVAVVGDAEDAVSTARRLALWSRRPEQSSVVLLAPDLRSRDSSRVVVTSLALAADQRNRWARRTGTTFVAVALDPGDAGSAWVRRALEVLDPAQVRYAAPAWRSANEALDRVRMIGGVDCLDLVQLDQSSAPAEFLSLEPPVATVDGRPATPELWAAHLLAARQHDHQPSPQNEFGGTA